MNRKDILVAKALNELDMLNLTAANSVSEWTGLIQDYFLNDEDDDVRSSDSDSDSETETVIPDIDITTSPLECAASGPTPVVQDVHDDACAKLLQAGVGLEDIQQAYIIDNCCPRDDGPVLDVMVTEEIDDAMKNVCGIMDDTDQEILKINNFKCDCLKRRKKTDDLMKSCSANIDTEFIYRCRLEMSELTSYEKDLVLLGKISCMTNRSVMTQRKKQRVQKERSHQKTQYMIEGVNVCRSAFRFIHE